MWCCMRTSFSALFEPEFLGIWNSKSAPLCATVQPLHCKGNFTKAEFHLILFAECLVHDMNLLQPIIPMIYQVYRYAHHT